MPQFQVVPSPPVLPISVGLLPTLGQRVTVTGAGPQRWYEGYTFETSGACLSGGSQTTPCDGETTKEIEDFESPTTHVPSFAWVGGHCSTLGGVPRDQIPALVRGALERNQGRIIERELWRGDNASGDAAANLYLAGGSSNFEDLTPNPGDVSPGAYALAALQMYLASCSDGGRGMIHATRSTVDIWANENLVRRDGNLLLDLFDNFIVAGAGYDGSDPDGNTDDSGETAYAYATGIVDVRLGAIEILPSEEGLIAALDRARNDQIWIAERVFGATWDGCCHAGIRVGLCERCCSPVGS